MQWPFAMLKDYQNGTLPAFDGDVDNDMQEQIAAIMNLTATGRDVFDDFAAGSLNTGLWTKTQSGSGSALTFALDNLANGWGAAQFVCGTGGGAFIQIASPAIPLSGYDFEFHVEVRADSASYPTSQFSVQLNDGGSSTTQLMLIATGTTWNFVADTVTLATLGNVTDTGYHDFLLYRIGSTIYVCWDGNLVYQGTYTSSMDGALVVMNNQENSTQFNVDKVRLRVAT